jgi:xeroderma pigmentosum group C-complementing protein
MPSYSASTSSSSSSSSEPDDWEDVLAAPLPTPSNTTTPLPTGNLELILDRAPGSTGPQRKKGASAEERRIRMLTHCMHVQFLVFHGAVRNHWCNDAETQAVLLSLVPPGILKDFDRAREKQSTSEKNAARKKRKGKEREGEGEEGGPERNGLSDPLIRPLGTLLHWWKKKFAVDTPGLRKRGYKILQQFQGEAQEEKARMYRFTTGHKDAKGEEVFTEFKHVGETIVGLKEFRQRASDCRGSRDTAALLLTALCRALGLEARMVFSLQPLGFGFGAVENASESGSKETPQSDRPMGRKKGKKKQKQVGSDLEVSSDLSFSDSESSGAGGFIKSTSTRKSKRKLFCSVCHILLTTGSRPPRRRSRPPVSHFLD